MPQRLCFPPDLISFQKNKRKTYADSASGLEERLLDDGVEGGRLSISNGTELNGSGKGRLVRSVGGVGARHPKLRAGGNDRESHVTWGRKSRRARSGMND